MMHTAGWWFAAFDRDGQGRERQPGVDRAADGAPDANRDACRFWRSVASRSLIDQVAGPLGAFSLRHEWRI
jgi:hypothetical protein